MWFPATFGWSNICSVIGQWYPRQPLTNQKLRLSAQMIPQIVAPKACTHSFLEWGLSCMKKCLHQFLADTIAWPLSKLLNIYNDTLTRPNIFLSMISGFIWLEGVSRVRFVLSYLSKYTGCKIWKGRPICPHNILIDWSVKLNNGYGFLYGQNINGRNALRYTQLYQSKFEAFF